MTYRNAAIAFVTGAVLVGAFLGLTYYGRRDKEPRQVASDTEDLDLELFRILGDVRHRERKLPGRWRLDRSDEGAEEMTDEEKENLRDLMALPYLQGSREAPSEVDVTIYQRGSAYEGLNLYTSGHRPEAIAADMQGEVLHRWQLDIADVWPEVPATVHSTFWRRVYWYPNGDILAIFEGIGLIKVDRDSRLIWAYKGGCHHEADVADNGDIYVLTRKAEIVPRINPNEYILVDAVTVLDADGRVAAEYPLLECFEGSEYRDLLVGMRKKGDIFHTNSIRVLDGMLADVSPHYKKGNVIVSVLKIDTVAIIDLEELRVVWAESGDDNGLWKRQHDPVSLPNGNLLIFDNQGNDGMSKVVEYDPFDGNVVWQFPDPGERRLYSGSCGASKRLPNGNILITESDAGRALEVTPDKQVVWEFYNPNRAGENGELIATLFEVIRVDPEYFPWLPAGD
jgi:hypothetical protein